MSRVVTQEEMRQFAADGAVCLRAAFSPHWVQTVRRGIAANMAAPSGYAESLKEHGGKGVYFNDYCNWEAIPEFKEFIMKSPGAEIAGLLMDSEVAAIYHEHVLTKEPGAMKRTPWHHDQSYYPIDGFKVCSIWMPVDPVPMETAIEFVRGSHLWPSWFHPRKFATEQHYPVCGPTGGPHRHYQDVPTAEIDSGRHQIIRWAMEVMMR